MLLERQVITIAPASKAQQKAVNKYMREKYDRVNLTMPKGKKERITEHVKKQDESLNGFINRAIDETMERDNQKYTSCQREKKKLYWK